MHKVLSIIFLSFILLPITICLAAKKQSAQMPPVIISATKARAITYQKHVFAVGSLKALQGISLKPESAGRITAIYFKSGDYVRKGTPLIQINSDILKAQYQQAQANLKLSRLTYVRNIRLFKQHAVSQASLDQSAAQLTANRGKVAEINAYLKQNRITAPFSGKLGLRQISLGDYVDQTQTIVNLESLDPIRVDFSLPQNYLSSLRLGQTIVLTTDAYPKQKFSGKVYALESLIDRNTRSIDVRATISNKEHKLLPGMFVEVALAIGKQEKVIILPQTALASGANGFFVYKIANKKAIRTTVTIGHRDSKNVIITSGLKNGDEVVSAGTNKVYPEAHLIIR